MKTLSTGLRPALLAAQPPASFRRTRSTRRLLGPIAVLGGLVAAVAFVLGIVDGARGVQATGPFEAGTSCSDIYLDIGNDTVLGSPHDLNDVLAANSISRFEADQGGGDPEDVDITTVTYLGPDLVPGDDDGVGDDTDQGAGAVPGDAIPDTAPASTLCNAATANANLGAENNTFHPRMSFASQYNDRPGSGRLGTYDPTNTEGIGTCLDSLDGDLDSGSSAYTSTAVQFDRLDTDCYDYSASGNTLITSDCAFDETVSAWARTDAFIVISAKNPKQVNYGKSVLTLGTAAPATTTDDNGDTVGDTATDPNECTGGLAFPAVFESTIREPATDEPGLAKNIANSIPTDADGAGERDSSDGLADDWDGDGCTDWDELDKNFTGDYPISVTGPVHGTDPFNRNDCDDNWDSTVALFVTVAHNTNDQFLGPGNGEYVKCIVDVTDPKGGGVRALTMRLGCYAETATDVINGSYPDAYNSAGNEDGGPGGDCNDGDDNGEDGKRDGLDPDCQYTTCPPAPANMCGDGQAGGIPPSPTCLPGNTAGPAPCDAPFMDIELTTYPILAAGTYDKGTGTITMNGCLQGLISAVFGGNVYGSGTFDARVGAGSFTIRTGITSLDDCLDGPPFADGTDAARTATIVELQTKKDALGLPLLGFLHKNSDRDNCSDTQELRSDQAQGGYRDPYNDYDYMNPTDDRLNRVDDILAVGNAYFEDDPVIDPGPPAVLDIDYASETDRTVIPGGNAWNVGPPNGQQRVDDILAIVRQYFHDCVA